MTHNLPEAVKEPCNECPWSRESAAGWLGPHTALEWLVIASGDTPIACHKTIPQGDGWGEHTKQCRGAAIFRANMAKSPRDPAVVTGPQDYERAFASAVEFYAHHMEIDQGDIDPFDLGTQIATTMVKNG